MKCISLWQPWASLIMVGAKEIETRSWYTGHRGPLLIHAAKRKNKPELIDLYNHPGYAAAFGVHGFNLDVELPYGCLLGVVDLIDCKKTESFGDEIKNKTGIYGGIWWTEKDLGNFDDGRYGWCLNNPRAFERPIPFKGEQGLFDVETELVRMPT